MSDAALLGRDRRLRWARPGSAHDRNIRIAQIILPSAVGALAAVLAIAPLTKRAEISFVLAKDKVAMATERMRVEKAQYRGQDDKGQPFSLNAGSAVQASSKTPIVRLGDLSAALQTENGPAMLVAPHADYDMDAQQLIVDGPLAVTGADGYRMQLSNVGADLRSRIVSSKSAVEGQIPLGHFTAGSISADIGARTVTLGRRAHLHIVQRAVRALP